MGEASISIPALMMTSEMRAPRMPSSETCHSSIMPAETSVARVMTASNNASLPEAMRASLLSFSPWLLT